MDGTSDFTDEECSSDAPLNPDDSRPDYVKRRETSSYYTQGDSISRNTGEVAFEPVFLDNDSAYLYKTTFGSFLMPKTNPSVTFLLDASGETIAASRFILSGSTDAKAIKVEVVSCNGNAFIARQSYANQTQELGSLFVKTEFLKSRSPKISSWFEPSADLNSSDFSIVWCVELETSVIKTDDKTVYEEGSIESASLDGISRFEAIIPDAYDMRNYSCVVDWSDAKCGEVTFDTTLERLSAYITFPKGLMLVDPTIAATSAADYATPGSPFRNVYYHNGTYWLFYSNGDSLMYTHSRDGGLSWSAPSAVPSIDNQSIQGFRAFDVAGQGDRVALAWLNPKDTFVVGINYIEGFVKGDIIVWRDRVFVCDFEPFDETWFGGVALAHDGTAYVSYSYLLETAIDVGIKTLKKPWGSSSFSEFENYFGTFQTNNPDDPKDHTPIRRIFPRMQSSIAGQVTLLVVEDAQEVWPSTTNETNLHWNVYSQDFGQWLNTIPWSYNVGRDSGRIAYFKDFSYCTGTSNKTHVALKKANDELFYIVLTHGANASGSQTGLNQRNVAWPSISTDAANDVHIVYVNSSGRVNDTCINSRDGSLCTRELFPDMTGTPTGLCLAQKISDRCFVSYTDIAPTPNNVMFGSFPMPADLSGPYSDPWSMGGLNQDQPFSTGLTDVISPGNGLLYLFQTDFVIPGRGMDMVVSRFFSTPQYFLKNSSGTYLPYLYEQFPYCDMGEGWQLNLPWIDTDHVHLWGGTRYAIQWEGNYFNNSKGQKFTLERDAYGYAMVLQDGMSVYFAPDGRPECIIANTEAHMPGTDIYFSYSGDHLVRSQDYLGRRIFFGYSPEGRLSTISYDGRQVSFSYDSERLSSTTDAINRATLFEYHDSANPSLLMRRVTYPTGGYTDYTYATISVGTEAIAKVIEAKHEERRIGLNNGHSVFYDYLAVDGAVKFTGMADTSGYPWREAGRTEYVFDSENRRTIVSMFEYSSGRWVPLKRTVSWYSMDGRATRTESYDDFSSIPDIASALHDSNGNVIYSVDPLGHEVFGSYAGTNTRNAFFRPGMLHQNESGKVVFEDFDDWYAEGWKQSASTMSIGEYMGVRSLDPSFKVTSLCSSGYAWIDLSTEGNAPSEAVLDCFIMTYNNDTDARLILSDGVQNTTAGVRMLNGSFWIWKEYGHGHELRWIDTGRLCIPGIPYRVTLSAFPSVYNPDTTYYVNLYIDGQYCTVGLVPKTVFNHFRIQVESPDAVRSVLVDNVKVFTNWTIEVEALTAGQFVELYDNLGNLVDRKKATSNNVTLEYSETDALIPFGYMVVRSKSGTALAMESCREIWGGDSYRFSEPQFLKGAITRTASGYEAALKTIMDDTIPGGQISTNFNFVDDPNLVLNGTKYHHDAFSSSSNSHYYYNSSSTPPPGSPEISRYGYFIQFVYTPLNAAASEIGLEYYYKYEGNEGIWHSGWTDMAYWGVEAISHASDVRIGDIPVPGKWSMLIVKGSDIDWKVLTNVRGVRFSHFGGDVYFDRSACIEDSQFGCIILTGLSPQQLVEFRKPDGSLVTAATASTESVQLDLYGAGLRCYPASGYFSVCGSDGDVEYESPVMNDIFPSDVYQYTRSDSPFYSNPSPPDGFGKLALGTMQYLDRPGTECMETYLCYGFKESGQWDKTYLVNETKIWNGTGWAKTSYIYDTYDNVIQTKDSCGARLNYSYVQQGTYLNRTWIQVGSDTISTRYEYESGLLKNEYDAKGRMTTYEYDSIGRIIRIIYPSLGGNPISVSYGYDDTSRVVTFRDENGTARKTYYDEYGRLAREERLSASGAVYSFREYCYDWNDMVYCLFDNDKELYMKYDYLGRPIEQWNADYTTVRTVYDDRNNTVSIFDEMGARKDMVYDANDRLVQSIQYLGSVRLYTNMTYDGIGNLLTVTDCANLTTTNEYDCMGRLVKTTYPYGSYQQYWYDNSGRLVQKRTDSGTNILYQYDVAGRLKSWSTSSQDHSASFVYDKNGNIVTATRVQPELTVTTARAYDGWDRLWYENSTVDGQVYRLKYGYDNRSNVVSLDIKDGAFKLSYAYDEFNRLKSVRHNLTTPVTIASFLYNEADQVTKINFKNGIWTDIAIDPWRGWIDRIQVKDSQKTYLDLDYATRDSAGRITSMTTSAGTRTHVYDAIGRLRFSNFTSPDGYGTFEFSYDWSGNRKTQVWGSSTTTYQYDAWGRISSRGPTPQVTYAYYNSPEPTGKLYAKNDGTYTWTFYYDPNDLLVKVDRGTETVEKYFYDAFGRRIKSIEDTTTEIVIYSGSDPVYSLKGTKTSYHVYANGMHLVRSDGTAYYFYHCDALGSVWLVTKDNKRVAYSTDYLPFGTPWYPSGTEDFGFVDAKKGKISGLVHMGARYYDPEIGRFITPDPVLGSLRTPASFNRFVYCMNDPIDRVDRDGMWSLLKSLTSFAAAVIDPVASFIGDVGEATVTFAVTVAAETWETLQEIKDVGEKFIEDVKDAAADVANTILSAAMAVKEAWDNLDPGLKQWIVNGVAMAVSFVPIVGPILSCVIDGTFVDMWNAIRSGDWTTLGMCALAFVPGMKGATKAFKLASHADDISKITKKLEKHLGKAVKEAKLTAKQERAALKNPNLRKAFMGERIDTQFKASVKRDDSLQGVVRVTGRFERGADVYLVSDSKIWWDVTTSSQWADHLNRYGQGGIHLFY